MSYTNVAVLFLFFVSGEMASASQGSLRALLSVASEIQKSKIEHQKNHSAQKDNIKT